MIALQGDRLVVAIGMPAAKAALSGKGETLADSDAYKAAKDSLGGENVDMFANPGRARRPARWRVAGDPDATKVLDAMEKFEYMVGGSGSEDNTSEFNLGLKD